MLRLIYSNYRLVLKNDNKNRHKFKLNVFEIKLNIMKKEVIMPDVILDLTDETKTIEEAIAECEANRKATMSWYKKFTKRIKRWFK